MFKLFSVLTVAGLAAAQTFMVNTPSNVVECEPTLISWTGGVAPYILSIQNGNNPDGPSLINLGTQTGTQFTWNTSLAPQSISLAVRDSTGTNAQSAAFNINAGSSSCLTATPSSSSSVASTSSTGSSSSGASTTTSVSSSASTTGSTTSSVLSSSTGTSTASKTSSSSKETSTSPTGSATTSGATTSTSSGATQVKVASFGVGALIAAGILAVVA